MASNLLFPETNVNLIITGPPQTGKKSFIQALTNNSLVIPESEDDISSVHAMSFEVHGKSILVTVWYVRNLEKSIEQIKLICLDSSSNSVILFWYAIDAHQSLEKLSKDYITVLRQQGRFHFLSLLVGNKADMRLDSLRPCLQYQQGETIRNSFHLGGFIECSAIIEQSVRKVFIKAVFIALGLEDD
ncbi:uncharacterized protein LOC129959347 [Argiope bruennichi]|uniref:Ras-like GTP-binding protein RhoL n=1 Tax=Argiope bruennichi TaxID=94029 RepID=A0A8T0F370_ARGBR|nr:uncharacterized protein LOC129959347 [Argiope bruennichi]KAF8785624.1 Ras-like GTP-binding protein RhoL [Argiope bruennichi]